MIGTVSNGNRPVSRPCGGDVHALLEHSNRGKRSLALDLTSPEGLDILGKVAATSEVYDVTATTEKSLSLLGLLSGPGVRREVLAAIESANDAGMTWLERHAAAARAGVEVVGVTGWTVASLRHLTSRRLDPFMHHHNVVHKTVVDEYGTRRALDARRLYASVRGAAAAAQARFGLTERLGVAYRPARHGGWETAGIGDDAIDEFSQRTREIQEAARVLG